MVLSFLFHVSRIYLDNPYVGTEVILFTEKESSHVLSEWGIMVQYYPLFM
jgi:hypothetical protein